MRTRYRMLLSVICLLTILGLGALAHQKGLRWQDLQKRLTTLVQKPQTEKVTRGKRETKPVKRRLRPKNKEQGKPPSLQKVPPPPFLAIDRRARNCPPEQTETVESLAAYLLLDARSDLEKARAIYVWLTHEIQYDERAYNTRDIGPQDAETVLRTRHAVCEGFSSLFFALGKEMGLQVAKVHGYAKGYGYDENTLIRNTDHAWNIVRIDGEWRIFDATWGQGYGENNGGRLKITKRFDETWFNVDPYTAIFSHLPEQEECAFVRPVPTLRQYEQLPSVDEVYFTLGFDNKVTYQEALRDPQLALPLAYAPGTFLQVLRSPAAQYLQAGKSCSFEYYIPRGYRVVVVDADNHWTYFEHNKGRFTLQYRPGAIGNLQVCVQHETSNGAYMPFLIYQVQE